MSTGSSTSTTRRLPIWRFSSQTRPHLVKTYGLWVMPASALMASASESRADRWFKYRNLFLLTVVIAQCIKLLFYPDLALGNFQHDAAGMEALAADPDGEQARSYRARLLLDLGRDDEALRDAEGDQHDGIALDDEERLVGLAETADIRIESTRAPRTPISSPSGAGHRTQGRRSEGSIVSATGSVSSRTTSLGTWAPLRVASGASRLATKRPPTSA